MSKKEYWSEQDQEQAVLIFLNLTKEIKILLCLKNNVEFIKGNNNVELHEMWPDFYDCLERQKEKDLEKQVELQNKPEGTRFSDKTWERTIGWKQPMLIENLRNIYIDDVNNTLTKYQLTLPYNKSEINTFINVLNELILNVSEEKETIFKTTLHQPIIELIEGVFSMPKFQKIIGALRSDLVEEAHHHLLEQLEKYDPNKLNKEGKKPKAFSYYGTVVKNFLLAKKIELDSKAPIEVDDDLSILNATPTGVDREKSFEQLRETVIIGLKDQLAKNKLSKYDISVSKGLIYMLEHWHDLQFDTKNQFVRMLCQYTQLKPEIVARSLKKMSVLYSNINDIYNYNIEE